MKNNNDPTTYAHNMTSPIAPQLIIRHLGLQPYQAAWQAMRDFTDQRNDATPDEIWVLEHPAVFTQGQAGKAEHILNPGDIPIVQTDRGGQVTYHGPGQLVIYTLLNLHHLNIGIRGLITKLENAVITFLNELGIDANSQPNAPGVYVNRAKICSLGLRVRRGCSYHGLAFNIRMDLEPFSRINPCGYQGLEVTQLSGFNNLSLEEAQKKLIPYLYNSLGYEEKTVLYVAGLNTKI